VICVDTCIGLGCIFSTTLVLQSDNCGACVKSLQQSSTWALTKVHNSVHDCWIFPSTCVLNMCYQDVTIGWKIQNFLLNSQWKMLFVFHQFFSWKLGGKPKNFLPLFQFEMKNSKESWKGVKKHWKFHHFFQWKMPEKRITFFTVNCAGKFKSANQCTKIIYYESMITDLLTVWKWLI
jgi:hypothetical protein